MSKTIQIEIPAPPDGWVYEERLPEDGEQFKFFMGMVVPGETVWGDTSWKTGHCAPPRIRAYRIRDEYAERYEALKLPDGCAYTYDDGDICWSNNKKMHDTKQESYRIIMNGKAIKP
jgi:hypothetical protein